jgi:hypothetical protein
MDHKPLEWLATIFIAYGRKGRWINMLHDFSFKIVCLGSKHTNANVLSRNPMDGVDDDDFQKEI